MSNTFLSLRTDVRSIEDNIRHKAYTSPTLHFRRSDISVLGPSSTPGQAASAIQGHFIDHEHDIYRLIRIIKDLPKKLCNPLVLQLLSYETFGFEYRGHHPYILIYARIGQLGHTCDTKRPVILSMAKDLGYTSYPDKAHKPNPQVTKTHLICHSWLRPESRTICIHPDKLPVHFLSQPVNIVDSMGKKCEKQQKQINKLDFTLVGI